jgi:acyl carrier protein
MVPSSFVVLEDFPLTPNGKVDRRALGHLDTTPAERVGMFVAPRTPIEKAIAEIWAEVLHLDKVGVYDDFFERGGHSLLAAQVISRLYAVFQIEIALGALLESPTVASLAELVVQQQLEHVDETALSELLAEIEQLSPEQAELALTSAPPQ